ILASGSESRRRVLTAAGVPFEMVVPEVDEAAIKDALLANRTDLPDIAAALADAKALAVSTKHPEAFVLAGDQVLAFEGQLISKCRDLAEARELLGRLRGRTHSLLTSLSLACAYDVVWRFRTESHLTMRDFSDAFLSAYLKAEGESVLSGVGCYKLEGLGAQLFERVEGDFFAILGLPLLPLLS